MIFGDTTVAVIPVQDNMGHGAAASLPVLNGNGVIAEKGIPKVDVEKMPLLSPYQLGPFKLSHRYGRFENLT